ncbi:hypothetical protein [Vibrio rotiferianus]|uniref:hypothetical protein n=1 Tax=Vibrio rotiferianus TaxID=190895 RepID=UPI002893B338|nr:conserved hypothetical protein [Vibrio rotiferianus]
MLIRSSFYLISLITAFQSNSVVGCQINSLSIEPIATPYSYDVFANGPYAMTNSYKAAADIVGENCHVEMSLQMEDVTTTLTGSNQQTLAFTWAGGNGTSVSNQWQFVLTEQSPSAIIQMRYPAKQWLPAGSYSGTLQLAVAYSSMLNQTPLSPAITTVNVMVNPIAKIQFYGLTQRQYDLDLGNLYSNKVISNAPNLWVQSNSPYQITVTSSHQGKLRHQSNDGQWDIDYQLSFDSQVIDLDLLEAQVNKSEMTSGLPIALNFVIGDTFNRPGGKYSDTLDISIEPLLSQQP